VGVTVASFDEFYRASRGRTLQCVYALTGDLADAGLEHHHPGIKVQL